MKMAIIATRPRFSQTETGFFVFSFQIMFCEGNVDSAK